MKRREGTARAFLGEGGEREDKDEKGVIDTILLIYIFYSFVHKLTYLLRIPPPVGTVDLISLSLP